MMIEQEIRTQAEAAKAASYQLASLRSDVRNRALHAMADALMQHTESILHKNAADVAEAKAAGTRASYLDRLRLDAKRMEWASYATFVSQWEIDNYLDIY